MCVRACVCIRCFSPSPPGSHVFPPNHLKPARGKKQPGKLRQQMQTTFDDTSSVCASRHKTKPVPACARRFPQHLVARVEPEGLCSEGPCRTSGGPSARQRDIKRRSRRTQEQMRLSLQFDCNWIVIIVSHCWSFDRCDRSLQGYCQLAPPLSNNFSHQKY